MEPSCTGLTGFGVLQASLPRGLPRLLGCGLGTKPPGERGGHRALHSCRFSRTVGGTSRRKGVLKVSLHSRPFFSGRSCPHPCGRTCGAGGPRGPRPSAAAPAPPHRSAVTSRASASASAGTRKALAPGRAPARTQTPGKPADLHLAPRAPEPLVHTFLAASGLPRREEPGSGRGRPSASARRHSRYSGDLTKRA